MSKEQIEEMAHDICESRKANFADGCRVCNHHKNGCLYQDIACDLFMLGYRKQAWISVEERLPEREGKYLAYTIRGTIEMAGCYSYYVNDKPQFDYRITHWMPLPAPPKGGVG